MANELYEEADKLLSGTTPTSELVEMGHPYGRNDGIGGRPGRQRRIKATRQLMPTLPINQQTGRLRSALRLTQRNKGTAQVFILSVSRSVAPYAKYVLALGGTVKMVARPFWQTLFKSWKHKNFDILVKHKRDSL